MKLLFVLLLSVNFSHAISSVEWSLMDDNEREEYLDTNYASVVLVGKEIEKQTYFPKLEETELYLDASTDHYGLIGPIERELEVFLSDEGVTLAGREFYYQQGCSHYDEEDVFVDASGYYENEEEANANNCYDNDVSWTGVSYRDHLGNEYYHSEDLEWTGH